jgi:hypothetical protein
MDANKTSYGHMVLISKFKNSNIMYSETLDISPKSFELIQTISVHLKVLLILLQQLQNPFPSTIE